MAKGTNLAVWLDLQNHPLGSQRGENFTVPSNYRIPPARIYVVNHSRNKAWKRIALPVSERRGAEEALIWDKELAKIYNVDTLYRAIANGRDMNRYKTEVHPVIYAIKVGGQTYAIPPAKNAESRPPQVEIREGAWDLFLGNYERIRSQDPQVTGDERSRLSVMWKSRLNPVWKFTDDGDETELDNPHGFLEFIRVTQKSVMEPIDKDYLTALDLVEA